MSGRGVGPARGEGRDRRLVERVRRIELDPNWRYCAVPVFWANGPLDVVGRMTAR